MRRRRRRKDDLLHRKDRVGVGMRFTIFIRCLLAP